MLEKTFEIKNKLGLHARPAARFVQISTKYKSKVRVMKDDQEVDGKSIMGLMTLAAECGSTIKVIIEGEDEQELLKCLEELVHKKFEEE
ncbi:MAG: HPr family phosphocarrier protein [Elusimicrobiota bacterium]